VLSSESFSEALTLSRLLRYLGERYFDENRSPLNEYRIGVEAMGRSVNFDPSRNSCVRVEMHRLRNRLRKYYETEGADHTFRIMLTEGRYGLRFVQIEDIPAFVAEAEKLKSPRYESDFESAQLQRTKESAAVAIGAEVAAPGRGSRLAGMAAIVAVAVAVLISGVVAWVWISARAHSRIPIASAASAPLSGGPVAVVAGTAPVLIMAGHSGAVYMDRNGRSWGADRYFKGGEEVTLKLPYIQGTRDPILYETAREGEFSYDIPVAAGRYELHLHFVEANFGPGTYSGRGESSRTFSVLLNDRPLLADFDIFSDAGGNFRALERVFKGISPGSDGIIHLKFLRGFDQPMINAIELDPEPGSGMNPVRMVMQDNSHVDRAGQTWQSDRYAIGGLLSTSRNPATNTTDPHLYDGERFGHFTYQIPVAAGSRYTVTLHFMEAFFGSESPQHDDSPRVFDVYANGVALLRNFNILAKAGGPDKVVSETFRGIEPNAAGLIVLSFVPDKNYACVSAIEVTDEAK
jgi:hypothetical protein